MPGVVARRPNEPFASSVAMLMKPPTAVAVGHHKTDPKANFTNNFKNLKKLFPTAQTQIFGHCGEKLLGGVEYAFWMTWYRIPLDTLGAQCCGKRRMQEGVCVRVCGTGGNVAEGGCCVPTIGKWPTINVRMLWGIKLLKNVEGGERRWRVRLCVGVCVCKFVGCVCAPIPRKRMENKWLWEDTTLVQVPQRVYEFIINDLPVAEQEREKVDGKEFKWVAAILYIY